MSILGMLGGGSDDDMEIVEKHAAMREKTVEELEKRIDETFSKVPPADHIDDIRTRNFLRDLGVYDGD